MSTLFRTSKRHGAGNDFLVQLVGNSNDGVLASEAKLLCDRHFGVGADGFIVGEVGEQPTDQVKMTLFNSDGSRAEMSGNGIRTLAHAVFDHFIAADQLNRSVLNSRFEIHTDAGLKVVEVIPTLDPLEVQATVGMGSGRVLAELGPGIQVDMGNPHLVVVLPDGSQLPGPGEVLNAGEEFQKLRLGGINVEWIVRSQVDPTEFDLVVFERGVGPTLACGTGSVASFLVARSMDMVGDAALFRNPGGVLKVSCSGDLLSLSGPSRFICFVDLGNQ